MKPEETQMPTTINDVLTAPVQLTNALQNPLTIRSSGGIEVGGAFVTALTTADLGAFTWTVDNHGRLTSSNGTAVRLLGHTTLTNEGGSLISGVEGINVEADSVISNAGSIVGAGGFGIYLYVPDSSSIENGVNGAKTALISGGIAFAHGKGSLGNDGTISGRVAITLGDGGTVENAGDITGTAGGISSSGVASVDNSGTITGGTSAIASHAPAMVSNSGRIVATAENGIGLLQQGGTVSNGVGGSTDALISGGAFGVTTSGQATIRNEATIRSGSGFAVAAGSGSVVTNGLVNRSALIEGVTVGVSITGGPGTVYNDGTIKGATAVSITSGAGTLDNAGRIEGDVQLARGQANHLTDHPGAVFTGAVNGGGVDGGSATLELAAGAGALAGLGTKFYNFSEVVVDRAAAWTLNGASSLVTGQTLRNQGRVTLAGDLSGTGTILNAGSLQAIAGQSVTITAQSLLNEREIISGASGRLTLNGPVTGFGDIEVAADSTVSLGGAVGTGQVLDFNGSAGTAVLAQPKTFGATIDGFLPGDTIDLLGIGTATLASLGTGNKLVIAGGSTGAVTLQLDPSQHYAGSTFVCASDHRSGASAGTLVTIVPADELRQIQSNIASYDFLHAASAPRSAVALGGAIPEQPAPTWMPLHAASAGIADLLQPAHDPTHIVLPGPY